MIRAIALLALAVGATFTACGHTETVTAQSPPLWGGLEPGAYDVGFRRAWTLDETRIWPRSSALDSVAGVIARPVRVDVWYPAHCAGTHRAPLRDYLEITSPEPAYDDMTELLHDWDLFSYHGLAGDTVRFERLMLVPTAVCQGAEPTGGRFPLLVYSAGWYNRSPDNTILAEFLASHGFVVAAVPQLNPGLWTYNFRSDPASVENQIRDLEVALAVMIGAPEVDRRRIAAMGYSTGGDVALLLRGRNPLIDVIVGLDASWTIGSGATVLNSPYFDSDRSDVPILVLRRPTEGGVDAPSVPLDSLSNTPRMIAEVPGGDHGSFSDDPSQRSFLGIGSEIDAASHALVARAALTFLQATVGSDVPFDGTEVTRGLQILGLSARFRPPE